MGVSSEQVHQSFLAIVRARQDSLNPTSSHLVFIIMSTIITGIFLRHQLLPEVCSISLLFSLKLNSSNPPLPSAGHFLISSRRLVSSVVGVKSNRQRERERAGVKVFLMWTRLAPPSIFKAPGQASDCYCNAGVQVLRS